MARIRTVKPEFWSNERVMACSRNSRLLFIGLWNFADDAGRCVDSAKTIKAQIFPGDDDVSSESVRGMLDELSGNGLLQKYEVDGRAYMQIVGWNHQRIDKPQPPKCPPPDSTNGPRSLPPDLILSNPKGYYLRGADKPSARSLATAPTGALSREPDTEPAWRNKRPSDMTRSDWEAMHAYKAQEAKKTA